MSVRGTANRASERLHEARAVEKGEVRFNIRGASVGTVRTAGRPGPALHLHVNCAAPRFRHQEWFHDHVRIEHMLFDGAPEPRGGTIRPDLSRPGIGLEFKRDDAERYRAG